MKGKFVVVGERNHWGLREQGEKGEEEEKGKCEALVITCD